MRIAFLLRPDFVPVLFELIHKVCGQQSDRQPQHLLAAAGGFPLLRQLIQQSHDNHDDLQRWLVLAFVGAERVTEATGGGQTCKVRVASSAIFALIFGFFAAFI